MVMKYLLMTVPARCKKCGGPVFSMGFLSESGLCIGCARMEAARKMSLTLD
jgi:predicted Zn-ribbon and HTH transcriptional regulator